jgi:transposase
MTEVRQRVTRDLLSRRGTVADQVWVKPAAAAHRRRTPLAAAVEAAQCHARQLRRDRGDWCRLGCEGTTPDVLAEHEPSKIRRRLADFYDAAIDPWLPEATRLAETIQTWWPAILTALTDNASNARTEGFNRIIKQTKRSAAAIATPYPEPHCNHPIAEISSMNGTNPAEIRRARKAH